MMLYLLIGYAGAGAVVAIAFAVFAAPFLVAGQPEISVGARLLMIPGAFLLWPLIVRRWLARDRHRDSTGEVPGRSSRKPHP